MVKLAIKYMRVLLFLSVICSLVINCRVALALSFEDIAKQLKYLADRDMVLSKNIANSNTPGYLPQDVHKPTEIIGSASVGLDTTNAMHIAVDPSPLDSNRIYNAEVLELKPNGNGVSIENEMAKKSENATDMRQVANLFAKNESLVNIAIGAGFK